MAGKTTYPIGEQDFRSLRKDGCAYIDKTPYIAKILEDKNKYFFLARPRRFGKSLFLSTLRYFFEGERELFSDLYIDSVKGIDWQPYPVLHLDLNNGEYADPENLDNWVGVLLSEWEKEYGLDRLDSDISSRFYKVIKGAHEKTGRQVVILVDEYDKPLVKNLNKEAKEFEVFREKLTALYSNFKTCAAHIKLVFLTGVSRFSKLSVFSGLNSLRDITFANEYADICGITEAEMSVNFKEGIGNLAEEYGISFDEACARLKRNYDGYRFAATGSDIYNPWSLLNCLADRKIANYWNYSGVPTIVVEALRKVGGNLENFINVSCTEDELMGFDLLDPKPIALMYQTGYLTIKDYRQRSGRYRLGIPNNEVKKGFFSLLLPIYMRNRNEDTRRMVNKLVDSLEDGLPDDFMKTLQAFFAGISYRMRMEDENNFHNAFLVLTSLLGIDTDAEVETSDGRIDMVLRTDDYIFIVELKFDSTARAALEQINEKQYALKYANDPRQTIKIGANFSSKTRRIQEWLIE